MQLSTRPGWVSLRRCPAAARVQTFSTVTTEQALLHEALRPLQFQGPGWPRAPVWLRGPISPGLQTPNPAALRAWLATAAQCSAVAMAADFTCQLATGRVLALPQRAASESAEESRSLVRWLSSIQLFGAVPRSGAPADEAPQLWDRSRTLSFGFFGLFYAGLLQRGIYRLIDRLAPGRPLQKVALDLFVHAPLLYVPAFYISTNLLQGKTLMESWQKLESKYVDTLKAYYMIWPVPMALCFGVIPERHRVMFIALFAFAEKAIYSYLGDIK